MKQTTTTLSSRRTAIARLVSLLVVLVCSASGPAKATTTYTFDIIATPIQLRIRGIQELPVVLREHTFPGPGREGFFGKYPLKAFTALIEDPSRGSVPLEFIPASGLDVTRFGVLDPDLKIGFVFEVEADPPVFDSAFQTPISGISEWQVGKLRIDLGPPIVLDDGAGADADGIILLDLEFSDCGGIYQPILDNPSSGATIGITSNKIRLEGEFLQDDTQVLEADGEQVVIDEPTTNIGTFRAVNGGELVLAAEVVNFGTIEALAGSTVTNQGFASRQLDGEETGATFDDAIIGGVFRVVDGTLNMAPDGFELAKIDGGTLEISGPQAETNFFDDASSSPGSFSTGGGGLSINNGGLLRLDNNVSLDAFQIDFFLGGRLEVFNGAEVTTFVGVTGSSGTVAGDGSISATNLGVDVGQVEIGQGVTQTGTLNIEGNSSFQVQSKLMIDIAGDADFDALAVSGRLFIEVGEKDGAALLINVADGYSPPLGRQFQIATAGEIDGNFDIVCDNAPLVDFVPVVAGGTLILETVPDPIGLFRQQYGLALDGSEDQQDSSGNGIADIFYYVFGLGDPAAATVDRTRLPSIDLAANGDEATFSFVRPTTLGCLRPQTLTSRDLASWVTPGQLGSEFLPSSETVEAIEANYQRVRQTYTVHEDEASRFFSLGLELMSAQ